MSDTAPAGSAADAAPLVLVVMGVSGSGKSTVAEKVASELGWDFAEGDSMHPESNVAKMAAGTPLTDADRWPWLDVVAAWIREHTDAVNPGVITCSALKHSYRDVLRGPDVAFVHLEGSPELLSQRIGQRTGHFMPSTLLDSQLATFEPLGSDERHIEVDAGRTPDEEAAEIVERLGLRRA